MVQISIVLSLIPAAFASWIDFLGSVEGGYTTTSLGPQSLNSQASIVSFNGARDIVLNPCPLLVSPNGNTFVCTPYNSVTDSKVQVLGFGPNLSFISSYQFPMGSSDLILQDDNTVWIPSQGLVTGDLKTIVYPSNKTALAVSSVGDFIVTLSSGCDASSFGFDVNHFSAPPQCSSLCIPGSLAYPPSFRRSNSMIYFVASNNPSSFSIVSLDVKSCAVAVSTTKCEASVLFFPFITSTPPYVIVFGCYQYPSPNFDTSLHILDEQLEFLFDIPIKSDNYPIFSTYAHNLISVTREFDVPKDINQTIITSYDLTNKGVENWSKSVFDGFQEGFALDGEGKMYILEDDTDLGQNGALYLFSSDGTQLDSTPWVNQSYGILSIGTGEIYFVVSLTSSIFCHSTALPYCFTTQHTNFFFR